MIKIYNKNNITLELFIKNHIDENRPCVIKNFYDNDEKCINFYLSNIKNVENYKIGNVISYLLKETCLNNFMSRLNEQITLKKNTRMWIHDKNNLTRWHYDGNGQNVINICLQGKKRFYLAPPNTIPVYPLSNIALPYVDWDGEYIDIEKYDLLFIPSYWFHKVLTLENKTITINHLFYHKNNNVFASHRDLYLYTLHKYFNSYMCNEDICSITKKKPLFYCFLYGFYEMLWIYIILFIIFIFLYKINIKLFNISQIIMFILIFYIYFDNKYNKVFSGILKLYSFYIFLFFIFFNLIVKFILPNCNLQKTKFTNIDNKINLN